MSRETASTVAVALHEGSLENTANTEHTYVLSAVGLDRAGLVAQVSRFCLDRSINILDFASHVEGDKYTMMLQIDLADIQSLEAFRQDLSSFGKSSGLAFVLQHNDIFRVTNEIQS